MFIRNLDQVRNTLADTLRGFLVGDNLFCMYKAKLGMNDNDHVHALSPGWLCSPSRQGTLQRTIHAPFPHPVIPPEHPGHVHDDRLPITDRKHRIKRQPRKDTVRRIHNNAVYRSL